MTYRLKKDTRTTSAIAARIENVTIVDGNVAIRSFVPKSALTRVVIRDFSDWIDDVTAQCAVSARVVRAGDNSRFLAVDTNKIFSTFAEIATDLVPAGGVVLAGVRLAFVDVLVASISIESIN